MDIPFDDLTQELFSAETQARVPFLGAGVSISESGGSSNDSAPRSRDPRIEEALRCLRQPAAGAEGQPAFPAYSDYALLFLQMAMDLALDLERAKVDGHSLPILDQVRNDKFPPSASRLTEVFRAGLRSFENVADSINQRLRQSGDEKVRGKTLDLLRILASLAGVTSPELSAMSAYFESLNSRDDVLMRLADVLKNKQTTTRTHQLLARAASRQVCGGIADCLIISTNYDLLMERALEDWKPRKIPEGGERVWLPYVVLWMSNNDSKIYARFGNMPPQQIERFQAANPPRVPNLFTLKQPDPETGQPNTAPQRFVIVYKIHGCVDPLFQCQRLKDLTRPELCPPDACTHDSIVLSEDDYIRSIARLADNGGVVPSCVAEVLRGKPLLFMGYSLKDWNVRGFLKVLRTKTGTSRRPDYTVTRNVRTFEKGFFDQNRIKVLQTDLNLFADEIGTRAGDWYDA